MSRRWRTAPPLTDDDRWPWLDKVAAWIREHTEAGRPGVITCSALKRSYRDVLRGEHVVFVYLAGSQEQIATRLANRHGHYMPAKLLGSQFATLEAPGADEAQPDHRHRRPVERPRRTGRHRPRPRARRGDRGAGVKTLALVAAAGSDWNSHDTRLITATVLAIALIVALIVVVKMNPFLSLILGSVFVSFASGVGTAKVVTNFESGVGSTLQEVGLLIALGAMLGKLLADSGGADQVIDKLLAKAHGNVVPWAMTLVALIIGLPMFFEIGLVLLLPVIVLVTQRSQLPLMRVAIPALAGLSVLHGLIPPHPGPLLAINAVHAELGTTLALGLVVAIPTVIICGPLLSIVIARLVPVGAPAQAGGIDTTASSTRAEDVSRPPTFGITLATILFPVVLMLSKGLADIIWTDTENPTTARVIFDFIGEPLVALTLAVLAASVTFGYATGMTGEKISSRISGSVGPVAAVILIVGAGGRVQAVPHRCRRGRLGSQVRHQQSPVGAGARLARRGRTPAGHRLGDGGDDHRGGHRRAARRRSHVHAHRSAGPGHRSRLAVPVPRQRRRVLARQGVLRADRRADVQVVVGDGDRRLRRRIRLRDAVVGGHLMEQRP